MTFHHLLDFRPFDDLKRLDDAGRAVLGEEIFGRGPSLSGWNALLELFAVWPESAVRMKQLDLAEERLAGWDDSLRRVQAGKVFLYDRENLAPVARLAREFEIIRSDQRGPTELLAVANSRYAARYHTLRIIRSEIGRRGWEALAKSPFLQELRHLSIRRTVLTDRDLATLLQSASLPSLECLDLIDVCFSPDRLGHIREVFSFPRLEQVDFSSNALGDDGALALTRLPWPGGIRVVRLQDNYLTAGGARQFLEAPFCRELVELDLLGNWVVEAEKVALLDVAAEKQVRLLL